MIVGRRSSPATGLILAVTIPLLFAIGIGIRLVLWSAVGLKGDIDQFVLWVHGIAVDGWGNAYNQNLSFPAVMAWVWGTLAAIEPAFRTVTDSSDPAIRALMKVPASLADLGIAAAVGWWFRDRPWAAHSDRARRQGHADDGARGAEIRAGAEPDRECRRRGADQHHDHMEVGLGVVHLRSAGAWRSRR